MSMDNLKIMSIRKGVGNVSTLAVGNKTGLAVGDMRNYFLKLELILTTAIRHLTYHLTPPPYEAVETQYIPPERAHTRLVRVELNPPPLYTRDPLPEPYQLSLMWSECIVPMTVTFWTETVVPATQGLTYIVQISEEVWDSIALPVLVIWLLVGLPQLLAYLASRLAQ